MKKILLILVLQMLIAFSAISQTAQWLPVIIIKDSIKHIYTIDSTNIYHIAENKRQFVACYSDKVITDSLLTIYRRMVMLNDLQYNEQHKTIIQLSNELNSERIKVDKVKNQRWVFGGFGLSIGVLATLLLFI